MKKNKQETEKATIAAGCFWGIQYLFDEVPGVLQTRAGYTGGSKNYDNPSYEQVCSDKTGHAEVVEIIFDTSKVSYEGILEIFWKSHDPTTLNRQGPDFGSQYRSVIFYHSEAQRKKALASKVVRQEKLGDKKIVTEIAPAKKFYSAEGYHQKYFQKNGRGSCHI